MLSFPHEQDLPGLWQQHELESDEVQMSQCSAVGDCDFRELAPDVQEKEAACGNH